MINRNEIDILWQQAMNQAIADGEMFTRYEFAKLVADAEREACATIDVTPLNILASDGPGTAILKYRAAIRARSLA